MHEMSLALEIRKMSRAAVVPHGPGRIEEITVAVGELSAVDPELLRLAWEALAETEPGAGARLAIEWRPARQFCIACRGAKTRSAGSWLRLCPDCNAPLHVEGGTELDLVRIAFCPAAEEGGAIA